MIILMTLSILILKIYLICFSMGASIMGGLGAVGGILNAGGAVYNSERQIAAQREENAKNREYQTKERLATQEYNTQEREAVQAYNTPENQVTRFQKAGLNPVLAMGGTTQSVVQPQSSSPQSSPGGISPVANPFQGGLGDNFAAIVDGLSKIGLFDSNKRLLNSEIEKYISETSGQDTLNKLHEIEYRIKNELKDITISRAFEEYTQSIIKTAQDSKNLDKTDSEIALNKATEKLNSELSKYHGEKAVIAGILSKELINILTTWYNTQSSVQAANYGSARQSNSQAALNEIDSKSRVELNDATLAKLSEDVRESISRQGINAFQAKVIEYTANKLAPEANHAEAVFWKNFIKDLVYMGTDVFATYTTRGFYKALDSNAKARIDNEIHRMEKEYSPYTEEHVSYDSHGNYSGHKEVHRGGR